MPDSRHDPFEMDRFHDAVDRLAAGVPAPMSDNPDLQELLDLAGRLRQELPAGMPDPAFRESLKHQLIEPYVPRMTQRPRRADRVARFPYVAAAGAIAAVFVAVIAVGAFALLGNGGTEDTPGIADVAGAETATAIISTLSTVASPTEEAATIEAEPTGGFGGARDVTAVPDNTGTPTPDAPTATQGGPSPTPMATLIATVEPTPEPTSDRQLAMALPPVNSTTVESGPVPGADGGAGGATTTITYELATELPALEPSATAYLLAPPDEDPMTLITQIARELGLEGEVLMGDDRGKMEYRIGTDDGAAFRWTPETGVFKYSNPADDSGSEMTSDEVVASCRGWLTSVGYPVERLTDAMSAYPVDNTSWLVETGMDSIPQPGYGHPLGVRMIVNSEGEVVEAKGYWLTAIGESDVELISAEEAWAALQAHQGYWFGAGGAFIEGGSLRVESIELSYILTNSPDGLVLQPVIAMRGEFTHSDGISSSGVTVFIQAARAQARYSGP